MWERWEERSGMGERWEERSGTWNEAWAILIGALLLIFGWRNLARGPVVGFAQAEPVISRNTTRNSHTRRSEPSKSGIYALYVYVAAERTRRVNDPY